MCERVGFFSLSGINAHIDKYIHVLYINMLLKNILHQGHHENLAWKGKGKKKKVILSCYIQGI